MNKKDSYALGVAMALLEKQYGIELEITANGPEKQKHIDAWLAGLASVEGQVSEWNEEDPQIDGVYQVLSTDPDFGTNHVWARFIKSMGWSKYTENKADLDAPTLPIVSGAWLWKK
jgi:hypothetical protein